MNCRSGSSCCCLTSRSPAFASCGPKDMLSGYQEVLKFPGALGRIGIQVLDHGWPWSPAISKAKVYALELTWDPFFICGPFLLKVAHLRTHLQKVRGRGARTPLAPARVVFLLESHFWTQTRIPVLDFHDGGAGFDSIFNPKRQPQFCDTLQNPGSDSSCRNRRRFTRNSPWRCWGRKLAR